jgi:hypothetical protein
MPYPSPKRRQPSERSSRWLSWMKLHHHARPRLRGDADRPARHLAVQQPGAVRQRDAREARTLAALGIGGRKRPQDAHTAQGFVPADVEGPRLVPQHSARHGGRQGLHVRAAAVATGQQQQGQCSEGRRDHGYPSPDPSPYPDPDPDPDPSPDPSPYPDPDPDPYPYPDPYPDPDPYPSPSPYPSPYPYPDPYPSPSPYPLSASADNSAASSTRITFAPPEPCVVPQHQRQSM